MRCLLGAAAVFVWAATPAVAASLQQAGTHPKAPTTDFMSMLFVFMLATFIGLGVITRVSRLLHTPLMSLTNAISAIAVVGSIIIAGEEKTVLSTVLRKVFSSPAMISEPTTAMAEIALVSDMSGVWSSLDTF
jgi:NAD(P) transhydrogenase subunit alpha